MSACDPNFTASAAPSGDAGVQRPRKRLVRFGKHHPRVLKYVDEARLRLEPPLPHRIFITTAQTRTVYRRCARIEPLTPELRLELKHELTRLDGRVTSLATLGAWRMTQGVFRLADGPDMARAQHEVMAALPDVDVAALAAMPQWCVYLESAGLRTPSGHPVTTLEHARRVAGAWLRLDAVLAQEQDADSGVALDAHFDLVVSLDMCDDDRDILPSVRLALRGTIAQAIESMAGQIAVGLAMPEDQAAALSSALLLGFASLAAADRFLGPHSDGQQPGNPQPHRLSAWMTKAMAALQPTEWLVEAESLSCVGALSRLRERAGAVRREIDSLASVLDCQLAESTGTAS